MNTKLLADLRAGGVTRVWALEELIHAPAADPDITTELRSALHDTTPCRIDQYYVGETRLLAGLAMAAEKWTTGDEGPVNIRCIRPLQISYLMTLLEEVNMPWPETSEDADAAIAAFTLANTLGLLDESDLQLTFETNIEEIALKDQSSNYNDEPSTDDEQQTSSTHSASEEDVQFYIDVLTHGDREARSNALQTLMQVPTRDDRVVDAILPLLDDTTPTLLQIPYMFGEVRLLAAAALAAERSARDDENPVEIRSKAPVKTDQLEEKRLALKLPVPAHAGDPIEGQLALFALLRDHGALPDVDFKLRHPVYFSFL